MTEQWQELKETITELRDNDGTATQQEACKFLVNYMDVLEKQIQEPREDTISRQAVLDLAKKGILVSNGNYKSVCKAIYELPSVNPQEKTGHWIWRTEDIYRCSECGNDIRVKEVMNVPQYVCCPMCEARMIKPQESEGK